MMNPHEPFLLCADAHIDESASDAAERFFDFLKHAAELPARVNMVFLGDILELWPAAGTEYECLYHQRFRTWCREQVKIRKIFFLEGNHEFFLAQNCEELFSEVTPGEIHMGELVFTHGDLINAADWKYHLLRSAVRNPLTYALARIFRKSIGPVTADWIRRSLKTANMAHKKYFPHDFAMQYLREKQKTGVKLIVIGHFHAEMRLEEQGCTLSALPAFANKGEAGWLDSGAEIPEIREWQDLSVFRHVPCPGTQTE